MYQKFAIFKTKKTLEVFILDKEGLSTYEMSLDKFIPIEDGEVFYSITKGNKGSATIEIAVESYPNENDYNSTMFKAIVVSNKSELFAQINSLDRGTYIGVAENAYTDMKTALQGSHALGVWNPKDFMCAKDLFVRAYARASIYEGDGVTTPIPSAKTFFEVLNKILQRNGVQK